MLLGGADADADAPARVPGRVARVADDQGAVSAELNQIRARVRQASVRSGSALRRAAIIPRRAPAAAAAAAASRARAQQAAAKPLVPHPWAAATELFRHRPPGKPASSSYRSIDYVLMSETARTNRHMRRLVQGGEPWAAELLRLLLVDAHFATLACMKSQYLRKELVEGLACIEQVEAALGLERWRPVPGPRAVAGAGASPGAPSYATDGSVHGPVVIDNYPEAAVAGQGADVAELPPPQLQPLQPPPPPPQCTATPEYDGLGLTIVDLCSGKGCQGVLLALRFPAARVVMCDSQASHEAVRSARPGSSPCPSVRGQSTPMQWGEGGREARRAGRASGRAC